MLHTQDIAEVFEIPSGSSTPEAPRSPWLLTKTRGLGYGRWVAGASSFATDSLENCQMVCALSLRREERMR
eukprot:1598788-Rhodomonas_salina.2